LIILVRKASLILHQCFPSPLTTWHNAPNTTCLRMSNTIISQRLGATPRVPSVAPINNSLSLLHEFTSIRFVCCSSFFYLPLCQWNPDEPVYRCANRHKYCDSGLCKRVAGVHTSILSLCFARTKLPMHHWTPICMYTRSSFVIINIFILFSFSLTNCLHLHMCMYVHVYRMAHLFTLLQILQLTESFSATWIRLLRNQRFTHGYINILSSNKYFNCQCL
jgi:hypothetical protein